LVTELQGCKRLAKISSKIIALLSSKKALSALDNSDPEEGNLEDDSAHPSDKTIAHAGLVGDVPKKSNIVAGGKTLSLPAPCADDKPPTPAIAVPTIMDEWPLPKAPVKVPPTRLDLVHRMDCAILLPSAHTCSVIGGIRVNGRHRLDVVRSIPGQKCCTVRKKRKKYV
jgi:hypothetical protein